MRKRKFGNKFNDEKIQSSLFPKEDQLYITTPKFEELRKKILRGDFKKNV